MVAGWITCYEDSFQAQLQTGTDNNITTRKSQFQAELYLICTGMPWNTQGIPVLKLDSQVAKVPWKIYFFVMLLHKWVEFLKCYRNVNIFSCLLRFGKLYN